MKRIVWPGGCKAHDENSQVDCGSSLNSRPRPTRKRLRSVTPSDGGLNGDSKVQDILRSPLAKRKKLAADRTGYSKLKEAVTADDLKEGSSTPIDGNQEDDVVPRRPADEADSEEGADEEEDEEDDFLARELEEEWG